MHPKMRSTHLVAAVVVFLSCALLSASCVQSPNADTEGAAPATQPEPTAETQQPNYEDVFHFVEIVKDDGEGPAGGWQEATASLSFCEWRNTFLPVCWKCPMKVGMPMRTEKRGRISRRLASQMTAEAATDVTDVLMHSRSSWVGQSYVYCKELRESMKKLLNSPIPLGATVSMP